MGMAGVGRQRTEESYDKNYIRKTLMELLMLANGKPILFRAIIHRESQGSGNRGYCTHLTLHFQGQPLNNTFVLTQHVMIKGLRGAIARFLSVSRQLERQNPIVLPFICWLIRSCTPQKAMSAADFGWRLRSWIGLIVSNGIRISWMKQANWRIFLQVKSF